MGDLSCDPERLFVVLLSAGFDDIAGDAGTFATFGHDTELVADFADGRTIFDGGAYLAIGDTFAKTDVHTAKTRFEKTIGEN